ncbi:general odorant-binding protein 19d [Drosophila takahashii]|uniref:general odorant-binding protein 19d n=1 Tax=Drosophila takahashii TaxID=29030 RepID=UPI001CF87D37|nr:general odorant-binding protein 19d [Drosophila takahashii]
MSRLVNKSALLLLGLVAMVCLLGAASAKPHEEMTKDHAGELANECKAETGATDEDVEQMMNHEAPERHEAKCLRACVMKKFQMMDESGKLSKEHAVEMVKALSKHDAEKEDAPAEVVDKCEAIEAPEDHCDAAVAFENCIYEQMKEHGLELEEH